jgi:hypothetical protein
MPDDEPNKFAPLDADTADSEPADAGAQPQVEAHSGDDAESPGRSLLDDDDVIVEPNEPGWTLAYPFIPDHDFPDHDSQPDHPVVLHVCRLGRPGTAVAMSTLVIIILLLALIFGGVGLFVEGLIWLAIIGLILLVVSAVLGFTGRSAA